MYHIVVNPAAGHGKAPKFVEDNVIPLLDRLELQYMSYTTNAPKDAGRIGQEIASGQKTIEGLLKVIVAGGDGTAHELIEGIVGLGDKPEIRKWELIILPLGTANALHASLSAGIPTPLPTDLDSILPSDIEIRNGLSSLIASLVGSTKPAPLPITMTTIYDSNGKATSESPIPSHIVLSTSLHAALLHTSDELRAEYPGLERFKVAAQRNLGVFFQAQARLYGPPGKPVQQYDPKTKSFVEPYTMDGDGIIDGPFTYFLSTTTCERLEPTFVINPTIKSLPPDPNIPTMDIVVLRPRRDPHVDAATSPEERRERWKKRAMEVIGHAYKGGGHIDLTYPNDGGETVCNGSGQVVVETFRVGEFSWTPLDIVKNPSDLICADGSIHTVPTHGWVQAKVASETSGNVFHAWA